MTTSGRLFVGYRRNPEDQFPRAEGVPAPHLFVWFVNSLFTSYVCFQGRRAAMPRHSQESLNGRFYFLVFKCKKEVEFWILGPWSHGLSEKGNPGVRQLHLLASQHLLLVRRVSKIVAFG